MKTHNFDLSTRKSFARYFNQNAEKLSQVETRMGAILFVEAARGLEGVSEETINEMQNTINFAKTDVDALSYIYNFGLAGNGLRVIR